MQFCNSKLLTLFILLFINNYHANAQSISIGEPCPEIILKNVFNYSSNQIKLKDLKGKYIILDFWGLHCGACIGAFPKVDSVQKKYKDVLQIIAVNNESLEATKSFFNKKKYIQIPSIPFVTADTILSSLFPHIYVPHHVWFDSEGIVRYITDGYNLTEKNINNFIKNISIPLSEKKYESTFTFENPMTALINGKGFKELESYSLLMHCISGITFDNSSINSGSGLAPNRITRNCSSISQLYEDAYGENGKYDFSAENTIIYNIKDKSKFIIPKDNNLMDEWIKKYSYNYELKISDADSFQLYNKMKQDLFRYFNVKGKIEKRSIECLALIQKDNLNRLKTKGGNTFNDFSKMNDRSVKTMVNKPIQHLISLLYHSYKANHIDIPFENQIQYTGNIDISLNSDAFTTFNLKTLKSELQQYGLDLVITKVERDVLILYEDF